jgi:hypothetical protein
LLKGVIFSSPAKPFDAVEPVSSKMDLSGFQRAGFGKVLVAFSTSITRKVGELVGCRPLVTDALLEHIPWYEEPGFKLSLPSSMAHKRENYPMFFPLPPRRE